MVSLVISSLCHQPRLLNLKSQFLIELRVILLVQKMFKLCSAAVGLFLAVQLVAGKPAGEKYTTKYDNVDLDQILRNDRLFNNYYNCLLDKGKCSPDGQELKSE